MTKEQFLDYIRPSEKRTTGGEYAPWNKTLKEVIYNCVYLLDSNDYYGMIELFNQFSDEFRENPTSSKPNIISDSNKLLADINDYVGELEDIAGEIAGKVRAFQRKYDI